MIWLVALDFDGPEFPVAAFTTPDAAATYAARMTNPDAPDEYYVVVAMPLDPPMPAPYWLAEIEDDGSTETLYCANPEGDPRPDPACFAFLSGTLRVAAGDTKADAIAAATALQP